ncbi:MAG: hypothetical protein JKP90_16630 [Desulfofustis sp. PB-SRB1]|nr:hypothetical protein [Desulfofustis sp. PB-SRB1]
MDLLSAWFSCFSHCVYLRRLFCSQCRAVHRLKPRGYWPRYRSSSAEIQQAITHRTEHKTLAARSAAFAPTPVVASARSDDSAGLRDGPLSLPTGKDSLDSLHETSSRLPKQYTMTIDTSMTHPTVL